MPIITFANVTARYPETSSYADATQADSHYVAYAIAELEGRLSRGFAVPFSDNNMTAKDLSIDLTYAKMIRFKDQEKAAAINSYIGGRIDALLSGAESMQVTSGSALAAIGDVVYSTTQNYHPVFGMSPPTLLQVSSQEVIDEEIARGRYP